MEAGVFTVEPWAVAEPSLRLDTARADRVDLRPVERAHRAARQPRRGRAARRPGHVPERVLRDPAAAVRRGRLRLPGRGPVADQRDERQADPSAGRRRAVRRAVRHAGPPRAGARPARRCPAARRCEWVSPAGQAVRIRSTRLVSFVQRAVVAVHYEVEAVDAPARIVVQSTLVANEPGPEEEVDDPRAAAALRAPLVSEYSRAPRSRGRARASDAPQRVAAWRPPWTTSSTGRPGPSPRRRAKPDLARVTVSTELAPGQRLTVVKFLAYGWSSERSMPALRDQVDAALLAARSGPAGTGSLAGQRAYLDDVWDRRRCRGRRRPGAAAGGAVRALPGRCRPPRAPSSAAIPAKGLTGRGYDGHTFWDMETYLAAGADVHRARGRPRRAALALTRSLPWPAHRARELRLAGAAFPWRTIRGEECSGYWPAGTAAFHINADIADAVRRYVAATGDTEFERGPGLELLVETARLWRSLGHHDAEGCFRIDGVTGPDEYTALVDNNVFTNLMAARNLRAAADAATRYPQRAAELGVDGGGDRGVARRCRQHGRALRRRARRHVAVGRLHPLPALGLRGDACRGVPAAAPLPVLPALLEPGRQAGRSRLRALPLRRRLQCRAEAARLRLLRGDHGARLDAVGLDPGDRRRRGRASRPRLRVLPRDGPRRSARSGRQHRGRPAPRLAGGRLAGRGRRVRRACATTARCSPSPRGFRPS